MSVIQIPKILQERLTQKGATALVKILNQIQQETKSNAIEIAEGRFERKLAEVETRIIRSTFLFIFGQFWMIVGVLVTFFK